MLFIFFWRLPFLLLLCPNIAAFPFKRYSPLQESVSSLSQGHRELLCICQQEITQAYLHTSEIFQRFTCFSDILIPSFEGKIAVAQECCLAEQF